MSEYIDISVEIDEHMVCWPETVYPKIDYKKSIAQGDSTNDRNIYINLHTGTHMDAPNHFIKDGNTIEQICLDKCCGRVYVLNVEENVISEEVIDRNKEIFERYTKVLFKTKNSNLSKGKFDCGFAAFDESGAVAILKYEIELIGIDYLSVQKYGHENNIVHTLLLGNNTVLLENINLSQVDEGEYELFAFPIKIKGVEGAPVRAVLKK
ncbi:MAG: hypothetical protein APF77_10970 [Clostridia bacterium BRH_c25]|nr:MAG: hypothetical protein APF77_10970 [Clostridia bacterium BRH_c25]